jgi:hypothetical protein
VTETFGDIASKNRPKSAAAVYRTTTLREDRCKIQIPEQYQRQMRPEYLGSSLVVKRKMILPNRGSEKPMVAWQSGIICATKEAKGRVYENVRTGALSAFQRQGGVVGARKRKEEEQNAAYLKSLADPKAFNSQKGICSYPYNHTSYLNISNYQIC